MSKEPAVKRLFWDIETSPNIILSWRVGYKLCVPHENILKERGIICICWKWEHRKRVDSLEWDGGDDRAMLEEFSEVANQADELIAHNGDRFDLPFFQGRRLLHDLPPIPEHKTVDTLVIARRRFKLNSNRLDYLGQVLGLGGKTKTEFQMWKDILLDNCPKAMAKMVRYCKRDVKLLQEVWEKMAPYHKPKTHAGVHSFRDRWSCPHCASENVKINTRQTTAAGVPRIGFQCKDCSRYYSVSQKAYNDYREWRDSRKRV